MKYFYPSDQQQFFTDRDIELGRLKHVLLTLNTGLPEHIALFGLHRIGKTLLIKELIWQILLTYSEIVPIYMDFSALCSSPENFVLGYVGSLCYWVFEKGQTDPEPYLNPSTLPLTTSANL